MERLQSTWVSAEVGRWMPQRWWFDQKWKVFQQHMKTTKPVSWSHSIDLHPNGFLQSDPLVVHHNTIMCSAFFAAAGLTGENKSNVFFFTVINCDGCHPFTFNHSPSTQGRMFHLGSAGCN